MKIYLTPGSAVSLTGTGSNNAARAVLSSLTMGQQAVNMILTAQGSSEQSAKGVSRVMVKTMITIPKAVIGSVGGSDSIVLDGRTEDVTLHAVLAAGPTLRSMMNGTAATRAEAALLVGTLTNALTALLTGDTSRATTAASAGSTLINGIDGISPINTGDANYGKATV